MFRHMGPVYSSARRRGHGRLSGPTLMVGVNYPWRHYGGDFGPTVWGTHAGVTAAPAAIADDLARMAGCGVQVVRWFVFTDARGGIRVDAAGWPDGLLPGTLADLDAALELAAAAGLQLVPVLFDHTLAFRATDAAGARVGGHGRWLGDPDGQARLLERVVEPVIAPLRSARRTRRRSAAPCTPGICSTSPTGSSPSSARRRQVEWPVPFDVLAAWVRDAADLAHRHGARVTIGGARLRFAAWWDDPRLGLDFLQAHAYYDPRHDFDLLTTSPAGLGLTRPLVIGECAAQGDAADPARGRPAIERARAGGHGAPGRLRRRLAVELARRGCARRGAAVGAAPASPPTPAPPASESPPAAAAARATRRPRRTRARGTARRPVRCSRAGSPPACVGSASQSATRRAGRAPEPLGGEHAHHPPHHLPQEVRPGDAHQDQRTGLGDRHLVEHAPPWTCRRGRRRRRRGSRGGRRRRRPRPASRARSSGSLTHHTNGLANADRRREI